MSYSARILADSVCADYSRLITLEITLPRITLSEFNTHRVFSRNSASSRAIPVEKRIATVEANPFVPESFGKNRKGMQATEELDGQAALDSREAWMAACRDAIKHAKRLNELGVHKQLANRVLEPFCWHTVIVTSTEWSNFFALRDNKDAQPEIQIIARMMKEAMNASSPVQLSAGEWHTPLLPDAKELAASGFTPEQLCQISVARCARVSYLTHDGKRDVSADLALYDRLVSAGHLSPLEHVAKPAPRRDTFYGNFRGWVQLRKTLPHEADFSLRK